MNRRSLLAGVAASSAALAGCLSLADPAATQDETDPEPPADPDDPIARATIGSQSEDEPPHRVRLWNLDDDRRAVALEIESADGTTSFDGSYDLDPEAHVAVFLHERDEYEITVDVNGEEQSTTDLEESSFDDPCPGTDLFVSVGGGLEVTNESDGDHC
ncbi:hypothetical protein [Natronorubrum tibetense]|uniref:Ig-like domain-containing protein n=1 Tax=Natronorubrum tibetense GA33 TaxID=1114856 RepID=L9VLP4_9EURY|nr:hypothetical protein [Natronorubrum tibetense]ELY37897.1 hypothetical protein C496_18873 [Natronorubrum tibetense GA33]